mmetsp:Transcript_34932/g.96512  ORF Transcript_34932/g.96512 Transcript_34932/m.96512 type:complete len:235 (-) Transcript_34932:232-936(-)
MVRSPSAYVLANDDRQHAARFSEKGSPDTPDTQDPFFAGLDAFSLRTVEDEECDFGPRLQRMIESRSLDWSELPRENDAGCVEYKSRLGQEHSERRVERLATQMRFRMREGSGLAFYLLGVCDSGVPAGLTPKEHADTVTKLMEAAAIADSSLILEAVSERSSGGRRCSAWRVQSRGQTVVPTLAAEQGVVLPLRGVRPRSANDIVARSGGRDFGFAGDDDRSTGARRRSASAE